MALTPLSCQLLADVGISTGDEGKGRLVYELAQELRDQTGREAPLAMVLKVNGGANSGHTAGGLKHNLLPCGIADKSIGTLAVGSGVVADPRKFHWEIEPLERLGYTVRDRLMIDERTLVSDLTHRLLDLSWEYYRTEVLKEESRGSTGRGISPAYSEETGQWQIYYADFLGSKEDFRRRLTQRADRACRTAQHVCQVPETVWNSFFERLRDAELRANAEAIAAGVFSEEEFNFLRFRGEAPFSLNLEALCETWWQAGRELASRVADVREAILAALARGDYVLGEFGQAYWLDKRHGFSPNVTASHTFTPELFQSANIPLQPVHVVGVAKAYDTKVGTHLFLTEMPAPHPLGDLLRKLEFGTSTGRQRMVGWFDAVEKGDALRYGGFDDLALNKLDVLTHAGAWNGSLLICTAYEAPDGTRHLHVPRNDRVRRTLKPVYESWPGWDEDLSSVRRFADLPVNARRYVAAMVRAMALVAGNGVLPARLPNLRYIGVGPAPSQIIRDVPATPELLKILD
jgi:adenylosuccinate synthase